MLELLYSRGVVGIAEIAEFLETNPRNVPEYRKELENAGYLIETVTGRYGGYRLDRGAMFPSVKLTISEKQSFTSACQYLYARSDFLEQRQFDGAVSKIASALNVDASQYKVDSYSRFPLLMDREALTNRYIDTKKCVAQRLVMHIEYENVHNEISQRNIHCYKLYAYNNEWFTLAFDERSQDMRYFKLNRIISYSVLPKTFRILLSYNESDYLDDYGMKQNGEWLRIKLLFTGDNASRARERRFGRDQILEDLAPDKVQVTFTMQNRLIIPRFVLGYGDDCQVLEPQWLIDDVLAICNNISNKYKPSAN